MAYAKQILSYERELKDAGTPDKQAEIHTRVLIEVIESTLVTKEHFDYELKLAIAELKLQMAESTNQLNQSISGLYKWIIGLFVSTPLLSGIIMGIVQVLSHYGK